MLGMVHCTDQGSQVRILNFGAILSLGCVCEIAKNLNLDEPHFVPFQNNHFCVSVYQG